MNSSERELLWLRRIRDHSQALADETRLDELLPLILDSAIEITDAERGYLVLVTGKKPEGGHACRVECARGFSQARLRSAAGDVSRTVVERVLESGQGLVTTREEDADVLNASSVQARRVVSIMCVPMRLRGEVRGVLYLDHRIRHDAFTEDDLPNLRTFADQAALALETAELRAGAAPADSGLRELVRFGKLVGNSPVMCDLYEEIERASRGQEPLLVLGEAGTGKALVAREIHARGELPQQPSIVQSCAAVSDAQLEGELFGHALQGPRRGALLRAERGTLILDDVADLSPTMQGKLVGVLRDRRLSPVGSASQARVQCRIIGISRHDLISRSRGGDFREDLFYRLDVQRIRVPSLRERLEDLPALIDHLSEELAGQRLTITDTARALLADFPWPGNVRQLRNEVRRLLDLDADRISARQLSEDVRKSTGATSDGQPTTGKTLGQVERAMVETAMSEAGGNKAKAARKLGIPRSTLYGLLERYGLKAQ